MVSVIKTTCAHALVKQNDWAIIFPDSLVGCDNAGDWLLVKGVGYAPSLASQISPFKMIRVICLYNSRTSLQISPISSQRRTLAGRVQLSSRSVRVVKLNAARQLTQAKISRARPALMDLQVKMQVLRKCLKMFNVVFCTILQLFSE